MDESEHSQQDSPNNSEIEIDSSQTSPKLPLVKGSEVWKHFIKDANYKTNKKATCKYCNTSYICTGGSTSNISKHLNKFHNTKIRIKPISKDLTISEMFNKSKVIIIFFLIIIKYYYF